MIKAPALPEEKVDQIEKVSWMMRDALGQLCNFFGLSVVERVLVLEHLHYCCTQATIRMCSAEEVAFRERAKAQLIAHAEAVRAENEAESAARAAVNTSGGQA